MVPRASQSLDHPVYGWIIRLRRFGGSPDPISRRQVARSDLTNENNDERRKPAEKNNHESRGGGNVWLVLILIIAAVLLSAFLFGSTDRRLRYPDLMALLKATADARGSGRRWRRRSDRNRDHSRSYDHRRVPDDEGLRPTPEADSSSQMLTTQPLTTYPIRVPKTRLHRRLANHQALWLSRPRTQTY